MQMFIVWPLVRAQWVINSSNKLLFLHFILASSFIPVNNQMASACELWSQVWHQSFKCQFKFWFMGSKYGLTPPFTTFMLHIGVSDCAHIINVCMLISGHLLSCLHLICLATAITIILNSLSDSLTTFRLVDIKEYTSHHSLDTWVTKYANI